MQHTPPQVVFANLAFISLWILLTAFIWLAGARWERIRDFRACMLAQWKPALIVTLLYLLSRLLGLPSSVNGYMVLSAAGIFCQVMIGLAMARRIVGFEPLPVTQSILRREHMIRSLTLFVVIGVVAALIALVIGSIGMSFAQNIFHETNGTQEARQSFPMSKVQAFFISLGGGIEEETTYRLVILSLIWAATRKRGLAIFLSALLFGAYHLSPLNGMYLRWLQFPISQFAASFLFGVVWGWVFTRRGYETCVLAHTLSDWMPLLLFT